MTTGESSFIPEYDWDGKFPDGCKGDWTNREARLPRRGEPPMGRRRINQTKIRTSTGIWTASYNAQNRPTRFTRENADGTRTVITAAYDYLGRRAWKKVETIATDPETGEETATITLHQRYIYRGYLQVAACDLTRGGHPCLWLITWDPTQPMATRPLAIQKDGTWYCYGWDLTKNICEVYGQAGYIRTTYSYSPYGSVTEEGDVAQPLQWSSEYADLELGLVYYNYRYYNPRDGRWCSRDILREDQGANLYSSCENIATSNTDRIGLQLVLPSHSATNVPGYPQRFPGGRTAEYPLSIDEAKNICDEYPKGSQCCQFGSMVEDHYQEEARSICKKFMSMYSWQGRTLIQVIRVAKCLIKREERNSTEPNCYKRKRNRLIAHIECYANAGFLPNPCNNKENGLLGLPEGGWELGLIDVISGTIVQPFEQLSGKPVSPGRMLPPMGF